MPGHDDAVSAYLFRFISVIHPDAMLAAALQKDIPLLDAPGAVGAAHPVKGLILHIGFLRRMEQTPDIILQILRVVLRVL